MVNTSVDHSVVTQTVGHLSQNRTTFIRATGDWVHYPFLVPDNAILGVMKSGMKSFISLIALWA
jgi:hypothetical protein